MATTSQAALQLIGEVLAVGIVPIDEENGSGG